MILKHLKTALDAEFKAGQKKVTMLDDRHARVYVGKKAFPEINDALAIVERACTTAKFMMDRPDIGHTATQAMAKRNARLKAWVIAVEFSHSGNPSLMNAGRFA